MNLIVIDFETKDPYISKKLGAGWAYKLADAQSEFEVLGAAIKSGDTNEYITDMGCIVGIAERADGYIMHNASYDLGCLLTLGVDISQKAVYDTEVLARLYDSSLVAYGLDFLAKKYCGIGKNEQPLIDAVWRYGIYQELKSTKSRQIKTRPQDKILTKFAKEHMKEIQTVAPDLIARYAVGDTHATEQLYKFLHNKVDMRLGKKYSELAKLCVKYRAKGVRVDVERMKELDRQMIPLVAQKFQEVYEIAGQEFDILSSPQTAKVLMECGVKLPLTEKGNPSATSAVLEASDHPLAKALLEARRYYKHHSDFIKKPLQMHVNGRLYPELNLLRARTGRFSSSAPNIQQIPSRDEEFGPLCRSIFLPEEGEKWFSLDFSNQEGRLQVHFASLIDAEGAALLKQEFLANPRLDMHQAVADMAGISRTQAKAINLGLSYGMGIKKLAKSLQLTLDQAKLLVDKYNTLAPYLDGLRSIVTKVSKTRGYITTLGGRQLKFDAEHKVINQLIQGSAADQIIEAMIQADKEGLPVLFPVHDQICMSGTRKQAERMKEIMETCIPLEVPSVVDVDLDGGENWADAGH